MSESRRKFLKAAGLAMGGAGLGLSGCRLARAEDHELEEAASNGTRWAMVINVAACAAQGDCTRCYEACHRAHNVPNFEDNPRLPENDLRYGNNPAHAIKWIWRAGYENAFPTQHHRYLDDAVPHSVPVLCNHCDNPPCVRVCPTQATWKREDGIVMMDMHRCIGCRFCVVGCPYGSRSFNLRDPRMAFREDPRDPDSPVTLPSPNFPTRMRGVVEKCNFCAELSGESGEARTPYCARACPGDAIIFGDLSISDSPVRQALREHFTIQRKASLGTNPHVFYIV
jgi:molybdopterin-containing oxidoreductase family iron-sulfur binding subunit